MELTTIELRKLTAAENMILTDGESWGKEIYLGKNDKAENWREVSDEEYASAMEKIEAAQTDGGEQ